LFQLLHDSCTQVRLAALQTLGRLRIDSIQGVSVQDLMTHILKNESNNRLSITAAWVLTLVNPELGQRALAPWLNDRSRETRLYAAVALSATGKYGTPLMLETIQAHQDPYVRANLAIALIGQRLAVDQCCQILYACFVLDKEKWMWQDFGCFHALGPNNVRYDEAGLQDPETTNQLVQLEILNLIAIMKHEKAKEAIAQFLHQKSWGICGSASALLLTECDDSALELVTEKLESPSQQIRVQAALIIALWGRDERAIAILQQAYAGADRELKERILEGIGHIGASSSIPFLVDKMGESYQTLRIIAASALLESLYH
jgi:HEAT repeat protein